MRAPTLEQATFNVGSKPNGSRAIRAYIAGELLIFFFSGPTAVTANKGTDIAGELLIFLFLSAGQQRSRPTDTRPQVSY